LGLAIIAAGPPANAQTAASFRPPGDLNGDLRVTVEDAIIALRIVARLRNYTSADVKAGDVAPAVGTGGRTWGDGAISVADATRLLRRAVGLEPDPWPGGPPLSPATHEFRQEITLAGGPYQWSVSNGVIVSGTLTDENNKPLSAVLYFWNAAQTLLGHVTTGTDGGFQFAAPVGLYQLTTLTRLTNATTGAYVELPSVIGNVQVQSGMKAITAKRPPLPKVYTIQGTVSSVPTKYAAQSAEFIDQEHQFDLSPQPTISRAPIDAQKGTFTAYLPAGLFKTLVTLARTDDSGTISALPSQSLSVATDRSTNLIAPTLGSLSGSLQISGDNSLPDGAITTRANANAAQGGGGTGTLVKGKYFVPTQANIGYTAKFSLDSLNPGRSAGYDLSYVVSALSTAGNNTKNVLLPSPTPKPNAILAWIGDSLGRPIPNATVSLYSDRVYNVDPQYYQEGAATADRQGVATMTLPDGLYEVSVGPPANLASVRQTSILNP
jgi:hypothetical protein